MLRTPFRDFCLGLFPWIVPAVSVTWLAAPAAAVDYTWTGATSSYFGTASNWTPAGGPPNSNTDRAIFNSTDGVDFGVTGGLYEPTVWTNEQLVVELGILTFDLRSRAAGQSDLPVTYVLAPGGLFPIAAQIGTTAGSKGELTITGGSTVSPTVNAQGILRLGTVANSDGVLKIGASLFEPNVTWNNSGTVLVGGLGKGLIEVNDSNFTSTGAFLGQGAGAQGTIRVQSIASASWVNTGDTSIGQVAGATGEVSINAVSTWTNTGDVYVGGSSSGSGGTGLLELNSSLVGSPTTQIDIDGDLVVYNGGTVDILEGLMEIDGMITASGAGVINLAGGKLNVNDENFQAGANLNWTGGTFESRNSTSIDVGEALGSSRTISGFQSLLKVGGTLGVGNIDNGNLTVQAGADVQSIVVTIGNSNGAAAGGVATVTGNGSTMTPTGNLNVRGATTAELNILDGGLVSNLNAFIASGTNDTAQITVSGSGSQWDTASNANLGGTTSTPGGNGTLDIADFAQATVAGTTRVWDDFMITVDGGSLLTPTIDVHGMINAQGGGLVDLQNGSMSIMGGAVAVASDSTLDAESANITVQDGGKLNGRVLSDATTTISLQDSGSLWTTTGPLVLGGADAGTNALGALSITSGTQVNVNGLAQLEGISGLVLNGGTLQADTIDLGTLAFTGNGALSGDVLSSGGITANGDLVIGDAASVGGVQVTGPIDVGTHTVTLLQAGFVVPSSAVNINGGTLAAPNGIVLPTGGILSANGSVTGPVIVQPGSIINTSGSLSLGDATALNGFYGNGVLNVDAATLTLNDANSAVLDASSLVNLSDAGAVLDASKGLTLNFGGNIAGTGTVNTPNDPFTPLINNGAITGDSPAQPITLTGYIKGVGTLDNVVITGTDAPGFSIATVSRGSVTYAGTLEIELAPGGLDTINHTGTATLGGVLDLSLVSGFTPELGDTFQFLTAGNRVGIFDSLTGASLAGGLAFDVLYGANDVTLEVVNALTGDLDGDGFVGINDLNIVLANWNQDVPPANPLADPSGDGFVGIDDLNTVLGNWNAGTPPPIGSANIPEPGTLALLGIGFGTQARRRFISR